MLLGFMKTISDRLKDPSRRNFLKMFGGAALAASIGICCGQEDGSYESVTRHGDDDDDDTSGDDGVSDGGSGEFSRGDSSKYNVKFFRGLPPEGVCQDLDATKCIDDYLDFAEDNRDYFGGNLSEGDVRRILSSRASFPSYQFPLDMEAARQELVAGLNIGFLLEGMDARETNVYLMDSKSYEGIVEEHWAVKDNFLGTWESLLLRPSSQENLPGIVALHGHVSSPAHFRDAYYGRELAKDGFAVLIPSLRAMDGENAEDMVSREMLFSDFNFLGAQLSETLIASKVLKYLSIVDSSSIGLIGHSGGGSIACVAPWISNDFKALVTDNHSKYFEDNIAFEDNLPHDFAPVVYQFENAIRDFSSESPCPSLSVPYDSFFKPSGGSSGYARVLDHFNNILK